MPEVRDVLGRAGESLLDPRQQLVAQEALEVVRATARFKPGHLGRRLVSSSDLSRVEERRRIGMTDGDDDGGRAEPRDLHQSERVGSETEQSVPSGDDPR
jgi:hypothetical protein